MKNKIKRTKPGFTLVELLIVMAIISVMVVIVIGPLSSIYRARSKAVSNELSSLISQCKMEALSGRSNRLEVSFDDESDSFLCNLIYTGGENDGTVFKTEHIGNSNNDILLDNQYSLKENKLVISFSNNTGAVTTLTCGGKDLSGSSTANISVDSNQKYTITIYMLTGKVDVAENSQ